MVAEGSYEASLGTPAATCNHPPERTATPHCGRPTRRIGPRLVSLRNRTGPDVLQLRPQMLAQLVEVRIGPPVAGLRRIGGEVIQLPLVVEWARPIRLSAKAIGR